MAPTMQPFAGQPSRVAVPACPSYAPQEVERALHEAIESLGGMGAFVSAGQTVLLKPNLFNSHPPEHAVTTHPELVRQVVRLCERAGARRIWVGDSSVGLHAEARLWSVTGLQAALAGTSAELKSWHVRQTPLPCGADLLSVPEWYSEVDALISLPKLKSHCLTTLSCGLKNPYGIVTGFAKSQFHLKYPSPRAMGEFLVRVFATLKPRLTIADAIVAMEGNGPAHGRPLAAGLLLAARDAVALDATACSLLRIAPASVPMIRLAAAGGLGQMDASAIERVGSGVPRLQHVFMRPSLARLIQRVPDFVCGLTPTLFRLRPWVQKRRCKQCGLCASVCPKGLITKRASTGFPTIDPTPCIACFCCMESCPNGAIALQLRVGARLPVAQRSHREAAAR